MLRKASQKQECFSKISKWLKIIWLNFFQTETFTWVCLRTDLIKVPNLLKVTHKKTKAKANWHLSGKQKDSVILYLFIFRNIGKWISSFPTRKCFFPFRFCTLWLDTLISLHSCVAIQNSHLIFACLLIMLVAFYGYFSREFIWNISVLTPLYLQTHFTSFQRKYYILH